MAKKKRYERISNKDFYTLIGLSMCVLGGVIYATNFLNPQKSSKKPDMKLEKIADVDAFETIEPFYDAKNDSVSFNVQDRKNHVDYGQLKGGNLEIYDINHNLIFNKKFEENEAVEVKSDYLSQDKYMVKYFFGSTHYNITFGKK